MKVLIIGAAGMVGSKLARQLAADGTVAGQTMTQMTLADVISPVAPETASDSNLVINTLSCDLSDSDTAERLIGDKPDLIYLLAAIVSGEAETNYLKGYRINLDGTRWIYECIREHHERDGYTPKLIFTSSIAVYGAPFPDTIDDDFHQTPLTSYGTQKAIGELLLADLNRREVLQGIGLRLPTICIRPGKPNLAASSFFSNILREPINGQSAILPVDDSVRHWFASPRAAVGYLLHAATLSREAVGTRCNMNLPGLCATVAEELESLERVVGSDALKLVKREPDAAIRAIVANWPESFNPQRSLSLGFKAETSFDDIIKVYLEDEMSGA